MTRVRTGSRLHLGLLSLPRQGERWPDRLGELVFPARWFGGVGLMIDAPGVVVRVEPAEAWSAEGPLAARALEFAQRVVTSLGQAELPPRRIVVEEAAREHVGLGTGTQLGLAVGRALLSSWHRNAPMEELSDLVGRGLRSALGVHGFAQGGFLVEGGKSAGQHLSPLVARMEFPRDWRVLVIVPREPPGCHGHSERAAFERLSASVATSEALCRLVLLGLLPALAEGDLEAFGEAAYDFNARVGETFAVAQGGVYASPRVAELVAFLRGEGVRGVGQSSWGPGVFAFVGDEERAATLAARVRQRFGEAIDQAWITRARNHGAVEEQT